VQDTHAHDTTNDVREPWYANVAKDDRHYSSALGDVKVSYKNSLSS